MLDYDIQFLKGVGPKKRQQLSKLEIYTIEDLLNYFPHKYEDRQKISFINELKDESKVLLKIKIYENPKKSSLKRNMTIIKAIGRDDTGFIQLTFFNQDFLMDKLNVHDEYYVFGKVRLSFGKFEMTNPEIDTVQTDNKAGKIMPLYGLTYGITNNELTKFIQSAISTYYDKIEDIIPGEISKKYKLISRKNAIRYLHFPPDNRRYAVAKKTIAFEKLLIMQIGLLSIKNNLRSDLPGIEFIHHELSEQIISSLPYKLTNAQKKVAEEIKSDMKSNKPMNRLVQGDVGSGKTIIAFYAMLIAVNSGYQSSMMAPTEILALQHYQALSHLINKSGLSVRTAFLAGSTKAKEKKEILKNLENGDIDIIIGTHALIEDNVKFKNIGLVVTDEQHRFGVRQRAMLSNKGINPDLLVMTATPIPRTLALMLYGDLDISIIDEMPPGRQIIKTSVINGDQKTEAYDFIKSSIVEGRQCYIVAPLVEESENLEADSAQEIFEELKSSHFKSFSLGLLHGKMKNSKKEIIMKSFYEGKINVLVSTTVIEVGVNVPNAVIMLVLNAERFGLAQLHQLRGRVGRGAHQSYCILVNESKSKNSKDRMHILKSTNNGFLIAEEDLKIRGPGDFFGTRQSGLSKFEIKNIISNVEVVKDVQLLSKDILKNNPHLEGEDYINLKNEIINLFKDENIVFN